MENTYLSCLQLLFKLWKGFTLLYIFDTLDSIFCKSCNLHIPLFIEQYDAFVKFTHDQIMRRYGEQPASCKYLTFEL